MVFLNFHSTAVSDPTRLVESINNNFDIMDRDYSGLFSNSGITVPPVNPDVAGVEWTNQDGLYKVTDDALAWTEPKLETWSSWTNLTLTAPFFGRSGFTPGIRVSNYKNVELRGCVQASSINDPWPTTGYSLVSSGQFVGQNLPEMTEVFPAGTHNGSLSTDFAWGYVYVTTTGAPQSLAIYLLQQGKRNSSGTFNWISLDGVRYKAA